MDVFVFEKLGDHNIVTQQLVQKKEKKRKVIVSFEICFFYFLDTYITDCDFICCVCYATFLH